MNIETGKVYETDEEITAAHARHEPLMRLTAAQQKLLGIGAGRRKQLARKRRKAERALATVVASTSATVGTR